MFAGVVRAASGIWHVPVIAPAVIEQENASGELSPPPPSSNAIGSPAASTGVNETLPVEMTLPPMWIDEAVIVVICADRGTEMPTAQMSATAA
jgi:hypothetical protein